MRLSEQQRAERAERAQRAQQWRRFRKDHLFTQRKLAEMMNISRRTIQQIENGRISPHPQTLRRFLVFARRYNLNHDLDHDLDLNHDLDHDLDRDLHQ